MRGVDVNGEGPRLAPEVHKVRFNSPLGHTGVTSPSFVSTKFVFCEFRSRSISNASRRTQAQAVDMIHYCQPLASN